jgi:hypothetical protein
MQPTGDPFVELMRLQREANYRLKTISTCLVILTVVVVASVVLSLLVALGSR